jgi:hypothetical protein
MPTPVRTDRSRRSWTTLQIGAVVDQYCRDIGIVAARRPVQRGLAISVVGAANVGVGASGEQ